MSSNNYRPLNIGVVRLADGSLDCGIYEWPHSDFCRCFCDEHEYALTGDEVLWALPLTTSGASYRERKENLRELAVSAMEAISEANYSYGELADIGDFFNRAGKNYGLLREFRENGVPC